MKAALCFVLSLALLYASTASFASPAHKVHGSLFSSPVQTSHHGSHKPSLHHSGLQHTRRDGSPASGNGQCVTCVLGVALLEQYALDSNQTLTNAAKEWCTDLAVELPSFVEAICAMYIGGVANLLEADFQQGLSPDASCHTTLNACSAYPTCSLFSVWPPPPHAEETPRAGVPDDVATLLASSHVHAKKAGLKALHAYYGHMVGKLVNVHSITKEMLKKKEQEMERLAREKAEYAALLRKHAETEAKGGHWLPVPLLDLDHDGYADTWTYRGLQFRGSDCNDIKAGTYPGKNVFASGDPDTLEDSNCNGIWSTNSEGQAYEELFCSQTPSRGILAIGDSATAHFRLPPTFLTPSGFNSSTYSLIIQDLLTELDYPQCSATTAWRNSTDCPYSKLPVNSVYQRMRDQNLCMHRDYVNSGVNGESIDTLAPDQPVYPFNYTYNLAAIPQRYTVDTPSTVFFSLIGNDVCHAHGWNGATYTPVDVFITKALEELAYLDSRLAPGSHVIIMGEIDGRVLYDTLHDHYHPVGAKYSEVYDFLNCVEISPCWGWMNSNATIRNASSERAVEYNQAWANMLAENKWENFTATYFDLDIPAIINGWISHGGNPVDLIEPSDGFHPSQSTNMLIAQDLWNWMLNTIPDAVGTLNPNNAAIIQQFGYQGGYGY